MLGFQILAVRTSIIFSIKNVISDLRVFLKMVYELYIMYEYLKRLT